MNNIPMTSWEITRAEMSIIQCERPERHEMSHELYEQIMMDRRFRDGEN